MRIKNIHIENFRNIVRADVDFSAINIFTGRNSSGKSNFLLALSNALRLDRDFSQQFGDNVVTFGPGKNKAIIKTKVGDMNTISLYRDDEHEFYYEPKEFIFESMIGKKSASTGQKLFFTGKSGKLKIENGLSKMNSSLAEFRKPGVAQEYNEALVFKDDFEEEIKREEDTNKKIIEKNIDRSKLAVEDKRYFELFSRCSTTVVDYVSSKKFSSTAIYEFVTAKYEAEIYDQALNRLKDNDIEKTRGGIIPFERSKFIFLLCDVQKNEKQRNEFKKDLCLYSEGIIRDVYVNTDGSLGSKGEIWVDSPNAPKEISYVSAGTSVIIFFALLKNWLQLDFFGVRYQKPEVMIFDEVDSIIHPSLMPEFIELLKAVSKKVQLFISTHSPHFIDCFESNEVFWLRDFASEKNKPDNHCGVFTYKSIIEKLPEHKYLATRKNSELFVEGLLDSIYPMV